MYYSEYARIKRVEKWLEKLAYISVGLDFLVALASFFVLRRAAFSNLMLSVSGYLVMFEMAMIAVLFVALVGLKHYNNIIDGFALAKFRSKHRMGLSRKPQFNPVAGLRGAVANRSL